jgi:hypothetical protein
VVCVDWGSIPAAAAASAAAQQQQHPLCEAFAVYSDDNPASRQQGIVSLKPLDILVLAVCHSVAFGSTLNS